MSALRQLLLAHRLLPQQIVRLDAELFLMLAEMAAERDCAVRELAVAALYDLVRVARAEADNARRWYDLTPREQQVAALACLGYTNEAIAHRLVISVNTVRSHMRRVLEKYGVASKAELRVALAGWDFESWV